MGRKIIKKPYIEDVIEHKEYKEPIEEQRKESYNEGNPPEPIIGKVPLSPIAILAAIYLFL